MKKILSVVLVIALFTSVIFAEVSEEWIEAVKNTINVTLNGESVEADNLLYEGRTYVQLHEVSKMIGADLSWNSNTFTANLALDSSSNTSVSDNKTIALEGYSNPFVSYGDLGVSKDEIYGIAFKNSDKKVQYQLLDDGLQVIGQFNLGINEEITILLSDNSLVKRTLVDGGLGKVTMQEEAQVIYIPADPDSGFNFPYMLRIPAQDESYLNTYNDYLVFDMINNGSNKTIEQCSDDVLETLENKWQSSISRASDFGYPIMMPIVPRTGARVKQENFGTSWLYEHALDRDSVYVRELTTTDKNANSNKNNYNNDGLDYELYYDFDDQIAAMIKHSINYLNSNGFDLENKVIMDGYSASGTFTDRFTNLHPDLVKMVISGATVDDVMLPLVEYNGEELNFPIGVADYKEITGREFDLTNHNSVARLLYMGKDDTNNTVTYGDCYFEYSQSQIERLFGIPVLPRAQKNIELYGSNGAHGMLILDKGIQHGTSQDMNSYIRVFIEANADSDVPVYPEVTSGNLEKTIYK